MIVGAPPPEQNVSVPLSIHSTAKAFSRSALSVVQGPLLVTIVSGSLNPTERFATALLKHFADEPVVIGPTAPNLGSAHISAVEAMAAISAVPGWPSAPRPVHSSELLPERALNGDPMAIEAMTALLIGPLTKGGETLVPTLDAYLDSGGSIEACARGLYIHPNTVRYRLKKISDITGRDPTNARDAYVLRVASTVGRLARLGNGSNSQAPPVTSVT